MGRARAALALANLLDTVADEANGVVASASGRTAEGWAQDVELVLLPLTQRGDTHARMIGALAPLAVPFWLGSARLGALTLGNIRHLDPGARSPARRAARRRQRRRAARRIHGARRWPALTFRGTAMRGIPRGMRGMRAELTSP